MKTERTPLFCDADLAQRIELAESQLIEATALAAHRRLGDGRGFVIPIAGGLASFADDDSPFNKVVGLGFGGVPTTGELDEIEHAYAAVGAPVQVELPHLADPEIGIALSRRGYQLESFENVLGIAIDNRYDVTLPDGIEIRPSGDQELDVWLNVMADAVAVPDTQGVPWREEFPRDTYIEAERDAAAADITRYIALLNGDIAGGAGLRTADRHRPVRRRRNAPRTPPPRHPVRSPVHAPLRCSCRRLRRRRDHHPTRLEIPAERPTQRLRPPLHPRRSGEAPRRHLNSPDTSAPAVGEAERGGQSPQPQHRDQAATQARRPRNPGSGSCAPL